MSIQEQITQYLSSLNPQKSKDLEALHEIILSKNPQAKLWFFDGKNEAGKTVSNPNIGYGRLQLHYTDGSSRDFYQIGISANTTGISIYIMGLQDKTYLSKTFGETIGKATVTGYCIKFKKLEDLNTEVLKQAIEFAFDEK